MRKKLTALFCALVLLLAGCSREFQPPEGAYRVYFAMTGEKAAAQAVDFEYRTPEGGDLPTALARLVMKAPQTSGLVTLVPPGVRLRSLQAEEGGRLHLDFSEQYGGLSGIELTLVNACFTLTLCQLEGVEEVYITVEGEPIPYQALESIGESDFILSGAEEKAVTVFAALCFPREDGGGLGMEYREVVKTEDDTLASAVMAALLAGPQYGGLGGTCPPGTELLGLKVENGICYVDLSEAFLTGAPQNTEEARLCLYSIVDTLCGNEVLELDAVQLLVEGDRVERYGGVPAARPLEPDFTLIENP